VTYVLILLLKAALAAGIVVVATIAVERAGPFWGALIAALPIAATPAYVVIALEHPPEFVVESLLGSLSSNAAVFVLLTALSLLATRLNKTRAFLTTMLIWLVTVLAIQRFEWSAASAFFLNLAVCAAGIAITHTRVSRNVTIVRDKLQTWEILLRAGLVASLIAAISLIGEVIGPTATGLLAVFPVVYTSMSIILLMRHGGEATAAMMANSFVPLMGFTIAVLTAHLASAAYGVWPGLAIGLATSFVCSALLGTWRHFSVRVAG
jgi:uncharacterized membrane protein (GlpM family)